MTTKRFALAAAVTLALLALAPRRARAQSPDEATTLDAEERAVLGLINDYRASRGLGALAPVPLLNAVAHAHSADMGAQNYFAHESLDGRSPFDRLRAAGYPGGYMGENLAAGNRGAAATFDQWRRSPSHDATMLGEHYTAIGIARVRTPGSRYDYYWSTEFGDVADGALAPPPPALLARRPAPARAPAPPRGEIARDDVAYGDDDGGGEYEDGDGDEGYAPPPPRAPAPPARRGSFRVPPPAGASVAALEQQFMTLLGRAGVRVEELPLPAPVRAAVSRARAPRRPAVVAAPRARSRAASASPARPARRPVVVVAIPRADLPAAGAGAGHSSARRVD